MMDGIAKLPTDPENYAVAQLPGRQFPGVVFQGDSIHALVSELNAELEDALELLSGAEGKLRSVCEHEGVALPWPAA